MILLGNILSRRFLPQSFFDNCDKLVFRIALPIFLFCKLVESDLSHLPDPNAIIFCVIAIVCAFTIISVGALLFIPTDKRGAFVHGTFRANFSIIGFVLAETILGNTGATAIACATPFIIITSNILAVTTLTVNMPREKRMPLVKIIIDILKNIVTNPLIIGVAAAIPFMILGIKLPGIASDSLDYIKNIATPLALLSLGAVDKDHSGVRIMPEAIVATVIKLIVMPFVFILSAILIGFRGDSLALIMILGTSPTAATSYIMSKSMHSDGRLAKQIVLLTTLLCSFTIFIFAFILRYYKLI